jgi:enterochelin esterase-like enzyme
MRFTRQAGAIIHRFTLNMAIYRKSFVPIIFIFFICSSILFGCSSSNQPTLISIPAATTTVTPTLFEEAPTTEVKPTQKNLLVIQCSQPGQVQQFEIQSKKLNDRLVFSVYFPPCYGNGLQNNYPVIYLLHGQTYDQTQWQKIELLKYADQIIQSGRTIPFLIVMPFEQFHYRSPEGNAYPQALIDELIPWVESNYHASPQKMRRAIGGISRGASWAMRLGLQHYDLFGAVGGHSLPTFNGDVKQLPGWLDAIPAGQYPRFYIDIGRSDPEVEIAIKFEQVLNQNGIPNEWHLNEGRHNEDYWRLHVQEYLDWYTLPWRMIPGQ